MKDQQEITREYATKRLAELQQRISHQLPTDVDVRDLRELMFLELWLNTNP